MYRNRFGCLSKKMFYRRDCDCVFSKNMIHRRKMLHHRRDLSKNLFQRRDLSKNLFHRRRDGKAGSGERQRLRVWERLADQLTGRAEIWEWRWTCPRCERGWEGDGGEREAEKELDWVKQLFPVWPIVCILMQLPTCLCQDIHPQ